MGLKHMVNYHPYPRSCTRQEPKMLSQKPLKKAEFSAVFPREVKIDFRTFKGRAHMMFSNSTKNPGEWQEWTNRLLPKLWCSLNSLLVLSVELPIPSAYWRKKKSITRRMSCEVSWIFVQNIQHKKKKITGHDIKYDNVRENQGHLPRWFGCMDNSDVIVDKDFNIILTVLFCFVESLGLSTFISPTVFLLFSFQFGCFIFFLSNCPV